MRRIAVIGAGWAGLAAALALQKLNAHVTVFERSPAHQGAGGRASTAYGAGERAPFAIDNGQHVLLGAYYETLALFESLNIDLESAFLRVPATWYVPQHLNIATKESSAQARRPWNTGVFKQLPLGLALLKAIPARSWPALMLASVRLQRGMPRADETVAQWLKRLQFPSVLTEQLWLPLCYATLNTPPNTASAAVFQRVIQDGLLAGSQAAAMLVPRLDLGQLFPRMALTALRAGGAQLQLGEPVRGIDLANQKVLVHTAQSSQHFDAAVCAVSVRDAARLLPANCASPALLALAKQPAEPITTIHLNVGSDIRLPKAVCVLPTLASNPAECPIQNEVLIENAVAIDRAYLSTNQTGWHTVVLSCSGKALTHSHEALIQAALNRLTACWPALSWPKQCRGVVIHAKHATYACTADLMRPSMRTASSALVVAGDYVAGPYPATLEGAVRSGLAAARALVG